VVLLLQMQYMPILSLDAVPYFWHSKNLNMIFFRWLHTIYAVALFAITFLVVFPLFVLFAQNEQWHKYAYKVTRFWGLFYFSLVGIKVTIENNNESKWQRPCVYVANHFSYTDIASLPLVAGDACFVGKQSIKKAPLFGYYFRKLHIAVNRKNIRDRAKVIEKSIAAIKKGKSLIIFPEGGIRAENPPQQEKYKDGAFRTAITTGVPVIPISLPYNWRLLPDDGKFLLRSHRLNIVIHKAIDTSGLSEKDVSILRDKVFDIIQSDLDLRNKQYLRGNEN
jgi:1-acyl-sn-glycerol-3-phosphate acyltransferase